MGKSINESLINLFSKHRIVFWHDNQYEMLEEFQELKLDGVEKIKINNNEFSIKYEVLKNKPNQKFLIYTNKSENNKQDNWLLDMQLYSGIYSADKVKIWMNELDLVPYFIDTVVEHKIFFNSEKRKKLLKEKILTEDNQNIFMRKMLFVIAESEDNIEGLISKLFDKKRIS